MKLVRIELKKIITSYGLLSVAILSLVFNALLIFMNGRDGYADYVAGISETAGVALGYEFSQSLAVLPGNEYKELLVKETAKLKNVFDGYDAGKIAEAYISALDLSGRFAEDMRAKYAGLQDAVDEKAERGDSLFLYFAGSTYGQHIKLFGPGMFAIFPVIFTEGLLVTLLSVLFALGYENTNRTEQLVYSSKAGRRIVLKKYIAAIIAGFCAYFMLMALTFALYFTVNDYGGVWDSNVSSGFNVIKDWVTGFRPFTTWRSFTVLSYLLATIGVSLGVILCFSFAGFIAGTSIRNGYLAFLVIFFGGAFCVAFPMMLPDNSYTRFAFTLTPVWLLLKQPLWFTDGGINVLWRDFETWGVCLSSVVLAALTVVTLKKFRKKDIL